MKNIIILIAACIAALLSSCVNTAPEQPKYNIDVLKIVPDSLKDDMATWITVTVSASNKQMTGGDYEDPEDVIEEISEQAERIFRRDSIVLYRGLSYIQLPTKAEQKIYWDLRNK